MFFLMILQYYYDYYSAYMVFYIIAVIVIALLALAVEIFVGGSVFKWGLEAVDGRDESYGSRVGTIAIIVLLNMFLPIIGLFISWKLIGSRHDLNYGESILAYLVWSLPMGLIMLMLYLITGGIFFGIMMLIMMAI